MSVFADTCVPVYETPLIAPDGYKVPLNTFACVRFGEEYDFEDIRALVGDPGFPRLRAMMRRNAEESLAVVQSGTLTCCVLEYGAKRLGGFFYR